MSTQHQDQYTLGEEAFFNGQRMDRRRSKRWQAGYQNADDAEWAREAAWLAEWKSSEDAELNAIADARAGEAGIKVALQDI